MFKKYDAVEILPEFRDEGDETFTWVCASDEEKGRVDIYPFEFGWNICPKYVVKTTMIRKVQP